MPDVLLTIVVSPALEEAVVDWLLVHYQGGFTTVPCHGHGSGVHEMSPMEQVAGRTRQVAFWVQLPEAEARALGAALVQEFGSIRGWLQPIELLGAGE